jgi:SAM-dependent methyltransferase
VWASAFARVAAEYERARPSWPDEAVAALGLPRSAEVLDLAAGTGKLTRTLLGHFDRVVAVEPLAEMRALIPAEAQVLAGTADAIPLQDDAVDAVFVGEAFHWFATVQALAEIARVLRPGGVLALLWNRPAEDFEPAPPEAFWRLFDERTQEKPPELTSRSGLWRRVFPGPFGELHELSFPNELLLDRDGVVAHVTSWSQVAVLPEPEREALRAELTALLEPGMYRLPLRTELYWTRRAA